MTDAVCEAVKSTILAVPQYRLGVIYERAHDGTMTVISVHDDNSRSFLGEVIINFRRAIITLRLDQILLSRHIQALQAVGLGSHNYVFSLADPACFANLTDVLIRLAQSTSQSATRQTQAAAQSS